MEQPLLTLLLLICFGLGIFFKVVWDKCYQQAKVGNDYCRNCGNCAGECESLDQCWFWSEQWQKEEKEANDDIKNGHVKTFSDVDSLIDDLNSNSVMKKECDRCD